MNDLTKERQDLEGQLDGKQKNLGGEYSGQRKADLKERQRLIQVGVRNEFSNFSFTQVTSVLHLALSSRFGVPRPVCISDTHDHFQLVQLQAQEIDALKEEIGILSRKDGHILPPTQTAVPPLPPIGAQ